MWATAASIVSGATLADWALLAAGLLLVLYIAGTWNYDHFRSKGVPSSRPKWPFLGDTGAAFIGGRPFFQTLQEQYEQSAGHGVYGFFEFTAPVLLVREPELLKVVAVKEFDRFTNHPTVQIGDADPIFSKNLFHLKDQDWREMRATLSPAFTTSKIKTMFSLISECAQQMTQHLRSRYADSKQGSTNQPLCIDMKDLFSRMANDVIATAAFGVGCDSLKQPENEFYRMGKLITTISKLRSFIFVGYMVFPKIIKWFGARLLDPKAADFFDSLVHETIAMRRQKGIQRPDVLQLLMQAQEGKLKADKEDAAEAEEVGARKTRLLLDEDVSAQAIIFFFAGFDTVSSALCLSAYVLSHHQDEQKRLYQEIAEVMEKTDGKPTYEAVQAMKYLDAVVSEVLRLYPPAGRTDRQCVRDVQLPATATSAPLTVPKGQVIHVPIIGLHRDPEYWTHPDQFDPERFSDENKHKIKPFTYMPFGLGPRICIGQRFGLIEVKIALVYLLANFELLPSAKAKYPAEFEPGFNLNIKGGFWCDLKPR